MGSSKDHFLDYRVSLPGSRKYIREYLRENEIFIKNILGYIAQGPRYYRFMQKTRHQKSHATVPLRISKKICRLLVFKNNKLTNRFMYVIMKRCHHGDGCCSRYTVEWGGVREFIS